MSNKIMEKIEEKLMPIGAKLGQQPHLSAIKDGMMGTIPLTIIGGMSLILAFPPVDPEKLQATNILNKLLLGWSNWASANMGAILVPYDLTMAIMALFVAMSIAYSLAKHYRIDALQSAVIAAVTFLIVAGQSDMMVPMDSLAAQDPWSVAKSVIPMGYLDAKGLFTAMLIGLLTVEVSRVLIKNNVFIKMPEGVPPAVTSSFASLVPMVMNVALFYGLSLVIKGTFGMSIPEAIMTFMTPALGAVDSIWAIVLLILFGQVMWLIGMHGSMLLMAAIGPVSISNVMANAAAKVAGEAMPYVFTDPFWSFYILLGGSGATLALSFLMIRSKSSHLKAVGRVGFIPGLFNINEPIIFGAPLILNPVMAIPFLAAPIVNTIIAFYVTQIGLVGRVFLIPPWTSPAFIGAPLSTMDWKAGVLVLALAVIDLAIYYPFFKVYEKQLIQTESEEENVITTIETAV